MTGRSTALDEQWLAQWAQVPPPWQHLVYHLDRAPFDAVFQPNPRYLPTPAGHDFTPTDVGRRIAREMAWWVWLCGHENSRRIEPALLKWTGRAITSAAAEHRLHHGHWLTSIAELTAETILRHAVIEFERRNHRLPSAGARRNVSSFIEHLHLHVSVRCTTAPWWAHDIWDLHADPRIPQREHEPCHDQVVRLGGIEPGWLREGVRFWLRTALTADLLRWSSVMQRARDMARHLGPFLAARQVTDPVIASDRAQLRLLFTDFADYLKSPAAQSKPDHPLTPGTIAGTQSRTQAFYTFMVDHAEEAAAATGNLRWLDLTDTHTRLWGAAFRSRRAAGGRELTWFSTGELQQMLCYLDVLAADVGAPVVITHPDTTISVVAGLGDPQAARIWLLQALTGRRASEILMLDFDPLGPIPGQERPSEAADDPDGFVAKLRYQQTKVDGVIPTILVEQAVVNVIAEQQTWIRRRHPDLTPKYLFLGVRFQHQGQRPRTYDSYSMALGKLDKIHGLTDTAGKPMRFSQTHRLRHTRATELLNDGVPIHVVQRYLGHASPEMTLRYAATLAATAEAEFLRHKKIGAHGSDIAISPSDIYDMTQLAARTDRVLPNGVCLLPPVASCDKGNACLSCGHFATDATHLDELLDQRTQTLALIDVRRDQYRARTGRELTDDNVWIHERRREIASLDAIITRLRTDTTARSRTSIGGAGTAHRLPILQISTRGSHESVLRKADPDTPR
ncbi:transposase [Mycobacterium sp. 852013-50091_SCH5140682]|uniref:tyrosine-type recombinase/integrase n=1 Tax=Mycobacterium sp. 852013-50091_SCH5140682 TaxID=1834109 RepID=UPI0007E94DD1|nr:tyrosine-type recombinase/integrase [Mycobacterium sp. 852013-50091_SCH5140682]OBC08067.1 transposase [Mycobacterium sp. 852013-50091_SCH5140682]